MQFSCGDRSQCLGRLGDDMRGDTVRGWGGLARPCLETSGILFFGRALPPARVFAKTLRIAFAAGFGAQQIGMPMDPNSISEFVFEPPHANGKVVAPGA